MSIAILFFACSSCLLLGGCGNETAPESNVEVGPPIRNVLVFMVDTLRADHLGSYGYERDTSPNIDRFAANSVQFDRTYSHSPWTRTSVVSTFTSMYPVAHACQDKDDVADDRLVMMAEVFRANGFRTGGFSSNVSISQAFGVTQGFDDFMYFERDPWFAAHPTRTDPGYVPIEGMVPPALKWLDAVGHQPFFLYFHVTDPHWRYAPPTRYARWGEQESVDLYDGEIRYVDEYFQQMIDYLRERGKLPETLIIFTSDHGEEFFDHGGSSHGHTLYNELLHVPLIVYHPRFKPARRNEIVRSLDLLPTLIELFELDPGEAIIQGRSLVSVLEGRDDSRSEQQFVLSEVMYPSKIEGVSLQDDQWKLIWTKQSQPGSWSPRKKNNVWELYDVRKDPGEYRNLAFLQRNVVGQQMQKMKELRQKFSLFTRSPQSDSIPQQDPETIEALRSLGYVE